MSSTRDEFLRAAVWLGLLDQADSLLSQAGDDIYTAAVLGHASDVQSFLARDPKIAVRKSGPLNTDALTYLCFSKYLRLKRAPVELFVEAAAALLDSGASANTGFLDSEWESAIYGAAGVAQSAELTRLLLERGADPNDNETPYHAPETRDNGALHVLVESGRLTADSLTTMLVRKSDWHDAEGTRYLLHHGADPNRMTRWGYTALHQALRRDNSLSQIEYFLDHGADVTLPNKNDGRTAATLAAHRGRGDLLQAFAKRKLLTHLNAEDARIAACARGETPESGEALNSPGTLLAEFAGNGNTAGIRSLLAAGVNVQSIYSGDPYFEIPSGSTALHVAAWRARHETVKFLIAAGVPVNARDSKGQTALDLAIRARVDSYWTNLSSPESVDALSSASV